MRDDNFETSPSSARPRHERRSLGWLVIGVIGAAVVAAVLLAVLLLQPPGDSVADATPTPSPIPSVEPTPSAPVSQEPSPSASATTAPPTPSPSAVSADLEWTRTASFPTSDGLDGQ